MITAAAQRPFTTVLALLIGGYLGGVSGQASADPQIGRLFITPEVRAHLERQRQLSIQETRNLEVGTLQLNGIVIRSSGQSTVWINQQPQTEDARDTGMIAVPDRKQPGSVTLVSGGEPATKLKVGQTLDRATRATSSGLGGDEIQVHHRPAPQP